MPTQMQIIRTGLKTLQTAGSKNQSCYTWLPEASTLIACFAEHTPLRLLYYSHQLHRVML